MDIRLTMKKVARYMRMGTDVPEGALAARVNDILAEAEPLFSFRRAFRRVSRVPSADGAPDRAGEGEARPGIRPAATGGPDRGIECGSVRLARHLGEARDVYLACGTVGAPFDALLRRVSAVSGLDALIAQAIGAAAIEEYMDAVEDEIRAELAPGETLLSRYSPGYGDYPLAANRLILDALDAPRRIGVSLTETLLLVPSKTVTAVIGVAPPRAARAEVPFPNANPKP